MFSFVSRLRTSLLYAPIAVCVLFCSLVAPYARAQTTDAPTVTPFVVCYLYNPISFKTQVVFSYVSSYPNGQHLEAGESRNFFSPGNPDTGQPSNFYPGSDQNAFVVSFSTLDTDTMTWRLDGHTLTFSLAGPFAPCRPSYFSPGPALSYAAPGTYTSQYLGSISAPGNPNPSAVVLPISNANGISVSNVRSVLKSSGSMDYGNTGSGLPGGEATQEFYGDVTIAPGPPVSTALLVDITTNGLQVAVGQTPISFAGASPDNTGCPANVTQKVQGTMTLAKQLLGTSFWTQTVTIKNTSGQNITGPVQLALTNLSPNARLLTAAGSGTCPSVSGAPYITVTNGLPANGNAAVVLTFTNSNIPSTAITYTPVIVAGGSKL